MNTAIKYLFRFIVFLLIQTLLLDKIHLHQLITPYLYMLFILWLPFSIKRGWLMFVAFLLGYSVDAFRHHPGFHAAACVFMAYLRPFILKLLMQQDASEQSYAEPSVKSFGGLLPYCIYISSLVFIHHAWLFLLESWQFANPAYFFMKTLSATLLSLFLILLTEMLFSRKQKFKTNTV
jgi:rod shape-determining protein MreD